jgi:hypothetical protein
MKKSAAMEKKFLKILKRNRGGEGRGRGANKSIIMIIRIEAETAANITAPSS